MIVDILYFEGCPNHGPTLDVVRNVLLECGVAARIREIEVRDLADAQENKFLGSPTVRVNGVDVEPLARSSNRYGMMCRVYRRGGSVEGIPPRDLIEAAVKSAAGDFERHDHAR